MQLSARLREATGYSPPARIPTSPPAGTVSEAWRDGSADAHHHCSSEARRSAATHHLPSVVEGSASSTSRRTPGSTRGCDQVPHRQNTDLAIRCGSPASLASVSHPNIVAITRQRAGRRSSSSGVRAGRDVENIIALKGAIDSTAHSTSRARSATLSTTRTGRRFHRDSARRTCSSERTTWRRSRTSTRAEIAAHGTTVIGSRPTWRPNSSTKAVFAPDIYRWE